MASNRDDPLSFINPSSSPIPVSDGDGFLVDPIGSASGSFQNDGLLAGDGGSGSNSDVEFGFLRQEFRQNPLVGTVQIYDRHVFLCYKNPQVWPTHVEAAEFDRLPRLLSAALMARKGEMKKKVVFFIFIFFDKLGVYFTYSLQTCLLQICFSGCFFELGSDILGVWLGFCQNGNLGFGDF